ncbi:MAG: endolytic transglycosylase MltG [Azospirillum brasilense]|nr:MAG: endolytic transglycosylase MltG [Azospirillum brasilense]
MRHGGGMKYVIGFVALCALVAGSFALYSFTVYRAPSVQQTRTVMIERGTGARAMLEQLHREGLLPAPWKILLPVALGGEYRAFKAGEYEFAEGVSPHQVVSSIARGEVVVHAVTVPEGWTVAQVREALLAEPLLTGDVPSNIAEGSLFPDTMHFQRGDTRASIISRMQAKQREVLQQAWENRAKGLPVASAQEALILASIVEEETGVDAERRRVAAVYSNRLRMGMPLQADPTVAYGIAPEGMKRMLTRADLKRDTPYNTYTRAGLPPGPICNPGKDSIEAALNPLASDELFFVATGNGGHWFARTVQEHNANVAKYRAALRAQKAVP